MPARTTAAPATTLVLSRFPQRSEAKDAPAAMRSDAAHQWARRRSYRPPGGGSPTLDGNRGTRRCGPRPRQPRLATGSVGRRRTPALPFRSGWMRIASLAYPQNVNRALLDWSVVVG